MAAIRGALPMNITQLTAMTALQDALLDQRNVKTPLSNQGTSREGYEFTEVQGVTVCIGPGGGYLLPAVRSYQNSLQAAVDADLEFRKNRAGSHKSGHELGIVGTNWSCSGPVANCRSETYEQRLRRSVFTGRRG
jgi:hypothetical protein